MKTLLQMYESDMKIYTSEKREVRTPRTPLWIRPCCLYLESNRGLA